MRIPESGKFLLVESGIFGFGIRNSAQGIRNPSNDSNPESSTWNPTAYFGNERNHRLVSYLLEDN